MRNAQPLIAFSGRARVQQLRTAVVRSLVLEADRETVWRAISSDDGLAGWLAESATIDLRPGGRGVVRFAGGHERRVRIARCEHGRSITFDWAPAALPDAETRVDCVSRTLRTARRGSPSARRASRPPGRARTRGRVRLGLGGGAHGARRAGRARRRGVAVEDADAVFAALSDPTRRGICTLAGGAPARRAISRELPISRQAVSKHLLRSPTRGSSRPSQRTRDALPPTPEPLAEVAAWMTEVGALWDARLAALARLVERPA